MKKSLAVLLMLAIVFCAFTVVTMAEEPESQGSLPSVYLSDNGNDSNDGLTEATPVQNYSKALSILGESDGVILITDVFTYKSTDAYRMPQGKKGASYVIRGVKEDGSSRFVHGRMNMVLTNNLTFDNLTYVASRDKCSLIAEFFRLEFTESVTCPHAGTDDTAANYVTIYGGGLGLAGKSGMNVNLIIHGGTFCKIIGGCNKAEMNDNVTIDFGGTARIKDSIFCGGEFTSDIWGEIRLNITGGTVEGMIYLGGLGDGTKNSTYVSGESITVTVTGGTFAGISCIGYNEGLVDAPITIDMTQYEASGAEKYLETYIRDIPEGAVIRLYSASGSNDNPNHNPEQNTNEANTTSTSDPADTDAPKNQDTQHTVEQSTTAGKTETDGTQPTSGDSDGGCASSLSAVSICIFLGLGGAACVFTGRKARR